MRVKADPVCVDCNMTLPISVGWNRKYCNACQRIRIKKYRKDIYHVKKKFRVKPKKHICTVCAVAFAYTQGQNKTWKLCLDCQSKFYERLEQAICLLCGKSVNDNVVGNAFAGRFCSMACSVQAFALRKKTHSLLNSVHSKP